MSKTRSRINQKTGFVCSDVSFPKTWQNHRESRIEIHISKLPMCYFYIYGPENVNSNGNNKCDGGDCLSSLWVSSLWNMCFERSQELFVMKQQRWVQVPSGSTTPLEQLYKNSVVTSGLWFVSERDKCLAYMSHLSIGNFQISVRADPNRFSHICLPCSAVLHLLP